MLELVFLGTGSGIPTKKRNHAAIWLRYEGESFLWDCGEGTQRQLMIAKLSFMKINRIYITHWHADHWAGIIGLMQTMNLEKRRRNLYIYGPDAERFVNDILDLDYWGPRFRVIAKNVPYEGREITTIFKTKRFEIQSIPVKHSVPAVAYCFKEYDRWNVDIKKAEKLYGLKQGPLVGKLKRDGILKFKGKTIKLEDVGILRKGVKVVYSGDTQTCKNLEKISENADILITDATFEEEQETRMHSGAKDAAKLAKKMGVKKLVLTHFSRRYVDVRPLVEEAKKIFPNTVAAEDFMKIVLKSSENVII
ncbi:MAG TPA: ribonuclease Z [Candidatus Desulfofervidus auxilii]|uniref:Ribonuclease Z n=1 Tax=Desulfofervidus auxilii TaxID=1621989 RepID=A0A7V0IA28_DESA2|nr:ribonuclease Z [Candidatus Desulfofervidus auxilii]